MTAVVEPVLTSGELPERAGGGGRTRVLRRFLANKLAVVALLFIVAVVVIAIFAPVFAPHDPNEQALTEKFQAHNGVLGTDEFGRDQLSRLIYGARASLVAAAISVGVAIAIGVPAGIIAGYRGRKTDTALSRTSDALQSVPALILALAVIAVLGPGLVNAMLAVGIVTIPRFFRVARAAAVEVSGETFIEASRALGCSQARIMLRHIFPNTLAPLVVQLSLAYGAGITAEASLSFLGLGVKSPTASWGSMLASASKNYTRAEYMIYAPGVAIALTVLAFMLVGDGLRHAFGTRRTVGAEER